MEYQIYKSKYTGKHVDDAIDQIPNKLDKQTAQTESDQVYGKLADGSQTMFDVTMGATATTIPRRDTAGRIQVADGVSGNDAVNFKQLSAVESSVSGLNIENGTGTGSLVQTNVVSSSGTPYTNRANGSGAIAFGKNCVSTGNTAFTIGQNNRTGNDTGGDYSGNGGFTHGYNNINEGHYTEVGGSGNVVEWDGADTIVNGRNNHIINSSHSAVFGDTNNVNGIYNPNNGANDNIVGGKNNTVGSSGNIVGGESNTANGNNNSLIIGSHNSINTNSSGDRIVGGHYNNHVVNALMEIGNGTSNTNRKNAFVVLEDGRAKVQTAPIDNNDVTRKGDFKTINGNSLLGSGDLVIESGGSGGVTSVTTSGTGNAVTGASISGDTLTLTKGSTFALITDIPDTSNFVTLSGAQTISGNKTFTGHNIFTGTNTFQTETSGNLYRTLIGQNGVSVGGPGSGSTNLDITYGFDNIRRLYDTNIYTYDFPNKSGTLALTDDIPIKSATLSDNDTTLTLVLK